MDFQRTKKWYGSVGFEFHEMEAASRNKNSQRKRERQSPTFEDGNLQQLAMEKDFPCVY
jgi:hypothetical protein